MYNNALFMHNLVDNFAKNREFRAFFQELSTFCPHFGAFIHKTGQKYTMLFPYKTASTRICPSMIHHPRSNPAPGSYDNDLRHPAHKLSQFRH